MPHRLAVLIVLSILLTAQVCYAQEPGPVALLMLADSLAAEAHHAPCIIPATPRPLPKRVFRLPCSFHDSLVGDLSVIGMHGRITQVQFQWRASDSSGATVLMLRVADRLKSWGAEPVRPLNSDSLLPVWPVWRFGGRQFAFTAFHLQDPFTVFHLRDPVSRSHDFVPNRWGVLLQAN